MKSLLFVCYANVCRSPMAECVMKHLVAEAGLADAFYIDSAGTSNVALGKISHAGTREKLERMGVPSCPHRATQITAADYEKYDYILAMDQHNIDDMVAILGEDIHHKIHLLLEFTSAPKSVSDPWYTQNFDHTYDEILAGCQALLALLTAK